MKGRAKLTLKVLALSDAALRQWASEEWNLDFPVTMERERVELVLKDKGMQEPYLIRPAAPQPPATAPIMPVVPAAAPPAQAASAPPVPERITGPASTAPAPTPSGAPLLGTQQAKIPPQTPGATEVRHPEGTTADGRPIHPRLLKLQTQPIGRAQQREGYFSPDGHPLLDDTNPVLSAEEWAAERMSVDPDLRYNVMARDAVLSALNADNVPGFTNLGPRAMQRHGPAKVRMFRHPQHTKYLYNADRDTYMYPTELLMRAENLLPVFDEPQPGACFLT